ncbi:hypothetical protein GCM10007301_25200 [Azorhizobium oxalatiphilum]|uniref:Inner membrane protein n=1 Tax=Azorhizobium oxalatiphilum TaxID=980631 RepID=A0A917FAC7_9HYPH|nr:hypothetical protein [Azorhizobium oxalatiphilum]GGF64353.1 hypothetical protein GCM10007301_25200 [Azorhizobium oxalatiphilum]
MASDDPTAKSARGPKGHGNATPGPAPAAKDAPGKDAAAKDALAKDAVAKDAASKDATNTNAGPNDAAAKAATDGSATDGSATDKAVTDKAATDKPVVAAKGGTTTAAPHAASTATAAASSASASASRTAAESARTDKVVEPDAYEALAAAETPVEVDPPARPQPPSPFVPILSGAVAGGLVAVAAAWIFTQYLPPPAQSNTAGRLSVLEAEVARNHAANAERFDKVEAALRQMPSSDVTAGLAKASADIAALRTQVQTGVDSAKAQSGDVNQRLAATQKQLDELATSSRALDRAAAAVAVLASLRDAVTSGRPFAQELDAARAVLGASAGSLDPFATAAKSGYAPPAKLADRLAEAGGVALDDTAASGNGQNSGLIGRFLYNAEGLVRVTPPGGSGAAAAPDAAAAIKTAVAALKAGDLAAALTALATLPAPVQEKLKPITAEIEGRRDAANTAGALFQQALAAISGKVP